MTAIPPTYAGMRIEVRDGIFKGSLKPGTWAIVGPTVDRPGRYDARNEATDEVDTITTSELWTVYLGHVPEYTVLTPPTAQ